MNRVALRPKPGRVVGLILATALLAAVAIPSYAAGPGTATDVKQIAQAQRARAGQVATDLRDGVALSGPVVTFQKAIVQQIDVQVVAGPKDSRAGATQNATNVAVVDQNTDATSGDTTATDGGVAISGSAVAGSLAVVHQINVQVIAGPGAKDGVTQNALNYADVDQDTQANSGDASADGTGSVARSGNASALGITHVGQKNIQIYIARDPNGASDDVTQNAANVAVVDQTVTASTGVAVATDDARATSGDAKNRVLDLIDQTNRQFAW